MIFKEFIIFAVFGFALGHEGCIYNNRELRNGESVDSGRCTLITCHDGSFTEEKCIDTNVIYMDESVACNQRFKSPDLSKPYPDCCPKLDCLELR